MDHIIIVLGVRNTNHYNLVEGYNVKTSISWLDVFLVMFPHWQLKYIVLYTNSELGLNENCQSQRYLGFLVTSSYAPNLSFLQDQSMIRSSTNVDLDAKSMVS